MLKLTNDNSVYIGLWDLGKQREKERNIGYDVYGIVKNHTELSGCVNMMFAEQLKIILKYQGVLIWCLLE